MIEITYPECKKIVVYKTLALPAGDVRYWKCRSCGFQQNRQAFNTPIKKLMKDLWVNPNDNTLCYRQMILGKMHIEGEVKDEN